MSSSAQKSAALSRNNECYSNLFPSRTVLLARHTSNQEPTPIPHRSCTFIPRALFSPGGSRFGNLESCWVLAKLDIFRELKVRSSHKA
ncbi:hypothetical protein Plhal304r1_c008g0033051 [Plasmopara halstedii]